MPNSGKLVLVGMFALAVVLASIAVWHRRESTRRPLAFWGADAAGLIAGSSQAKLLVLTKPDSESHSDDSFVEHRGDRLAVESRHDLAEIRGMVHLRAAFVEDASFSWDAPLDCQPNWKYGLQFVNGDRETTVLVDPDCEVAMLAGRNDVVSIRPIAAGLRKVIDQAVAAD